MKFNNEEEKEFWKLVFVTTIRAGSDDWNAKSNADVAVEGLRFRSTFLPDKK
jgi:hypothetical protein